MVDVQYKSLNQDDYDCYWEQGYVLKPALFSAEEVQLLISAKEQVPNYSESGMQLKDTKGGKVNLVLWNHPGDDIFGAVSRCERMVNGVELLLDGEGYHYHSKLNTKQPHTKGIWEWHQDYGYWYENGIPRPDALSVMVALGDSTQENGCLQLIKGSHKLGKVTHAPQANQWVADQKEVDMITRTHEIYFAEMRAGDALFFHCNTLHRSDDNRSDIPRSTIISSFNRADNSAPVEHQHPNYTPIKKLPDSALLAIGLEGFGETREIMAQPDDLK